MATITEKCISCRSEAVEIRTDDTAHIPAVADVPAHDVEGLTCYHCTVCGEKWVDVEMGEKDRPKFVEARRRAQHLLSSQEIEEILTRIPYSGKEIGLALGLGPATISRWKAAKLCQSQTSDALLIAIGENPSLLERIAQRRGIQLTGRQRGGQRKQANSAAQRAASGLSYSPSDDLPPVEEA